MAWTVERLTSEFDLTPREALLIIGIARGRIDPCDHLNHPIFRCHKEMLGRYDHLDGSGHRIEKKMDAIDIVLRTCGVEAIELEGYDNGRYDSYFGESMVALYCNAGDTYATTIAYDMARNMFSLTSWGDLYEKAEASLSPDYSGETGMYDAG